YVSNWATGATEASTTTEYVYHWQDTSTTVVEDRPHTDDSRQFDSWSVDVSAISQIVVDGYAGGDTITNNSQRDLLAEDTVGPVTVNGGKGVNTLDLGDGDNTYVANAGSQGDNVTVGDGNNNITTKGPNNTITAGSGSNVFNLVGHNVIGFNGAAAAGY